MLCNKYILDIQNSAESGELKQKRNIAKPRFQVPSTYSSKCGIQIEDEKIFMKKYLLCNTFYTIEIYFYTILSYILFF